MTAGSVDRLPLTTPVAHRRSESSEIMNYGWPNELATAPKGKQDNEASGGRHAP